MKILHTVAELRAALAPFRAQGVGFVPTMGALHSGHAALVERSARENPVTVVSVFVNPTQFGPQEDFSRYPRTLPEDAALCEKAGAHFVFAPAAEEMYPEGFSTYVNEESVSAPLCGSFRPGHFRGVCTVVLKFLNIVQPTRAYFGEKDLQQLQVIRRMVRDLVVPAEIVGCPTVREADGLAMSSRNRYLSATERTQALVISQALTAVRDLYQQGERSHARLLGRAQELLSAQPAFSLQYVELCDLASLKPVPAQLEAPAALLVAGFMGKTRLIDNVILQ